MEEKRFKVNFIDGSRMYHHFKLTQSQIDLLNYLIKYNIETYDAEMSIISDTIDYEII